MGSGQGLFHTICKGGKLDDRSGPVVREQTSGHKGLGVQFLVVAIEFSCNFSQVWVFNCKKGHNRPLVCGMTAIIFFFLLKGT